MIFNNKKGGLLYSVYAFIMIFLVWVLWLGSFMAEWGERNITENALTGLEAMFWANLNLWFFLLMLMSMFLVFTFGGNN